MFTGWTKAPNLVRW